MDGHHLSLLKKSDLFESFSDEELAELAGQIAKVRCQTGEVLFREGEAGQDMFVLLEGSLRISKEKRIITTLVPVDYIGEMAIIDNQPRSATVEALAPSLLLRISLADFEKHLAGRPLALVSVMKSLTRRIRRDTETIAAEFEKTNILVHDMRNMLSTFLLLNAMERKGGDEDIRSWCRFMQEARRNLMALMDEALAHAKRLHYTPAVAPACLCSLIAEMAEADFAVHPDLRDRKVVLRVKEKPPLFPFSKLGIRRVVWNLVLNAAQASAPGQAIEIETDCDGSRALVRVR
ncbi:MAG: cyclic nucleotide-binding domain-containing protein, partial [Desulfobacteraceae bacterium]|nr:cyclic nucleotide-binding domain-containing protein [Desulfobacteraceae bacterium]